MNEPKYLSTSKISKLIDVNERWLREHRGAVFKEGVHYHFPNGFNDCRWNVKAMIEWVETPTDEDTRTQDILNSLCA